MKRAHLIISAVILLFFAVGVIGGNFSFHGKPDGIYLLRGTGGKLFELKDRLQLTEYDRLITRVEFEALYDRWRSNEEAAHASPYLKYNWHRNSGGGYLISFFPDGSRFLVCLGRFRDADNNPVKGIFVGGGLPRAHYESGALKTPETGVAYADASGWHHLWGSAAETIISADPAIKPVGPGRWEFISSEVLFSSQYQLALKSSHLIRLGQQTLKADRYLNYRAGDRFFSLATRFSNQGNLPLKYHYSYEDDLRTPDSGTVNSATAMEQPDFSGDCYIGMSGYSYSDGGERTASSGNMTNFMSWQGDALPDRRYLISRSGILLSDTGKAPLTDRNSRGVKLQWHSRMLLPGRSETIVLTIGMSDNDPTTGIPRQPAVNISPEELRYFLNH